MEAHTPGRGRQFDLPVPHALSANPWLPRLATVPVAVTDPSTTVDLHLDTLEYTREGLRTRAPLDLSIGRDNRVRLLRPKLADVPLTTQHGFALDRAFPLPATLALLWSYRPADSPLPGFEVPRGPEGTLQVFGHTDASGDEAHNKTLSERRAAVIIALLQSNVDAMRSLAAEDGWSAWEYQVLLRVLGSDPGPTDGDPGPLTNLGLAHFARRYASGFFHRNGQPRVPGLAAHAFDAATVEALLDAFVIAHTPDLGPSTLHPLHPAVGCSEFNLLSPGGGSRNRRVSVLTTLDTPHPENAPCTEGNANACAVVGEGPYTCMWYREHVAAEPTQAAALYDPRWLERPDGSFVLSVLTNLPEDTRVIFDVFGNSEPLPSTSPLADLLIRWTEPLTTRSVGGVATATWVPPEEVNPNADDGPVPVFRAATASRDAHVWATWTDVVGLQLLDETGRCFSEVAITLETESGSHPLTTDANGLAWTRDRSAGPFSVTLPPDFLLPHPRDTITVASAPTTADMETRRGNVLSVRSGSITRLRVQPPEAAPGYISCHFDQGSVYPADTLVALVEQARDALEAQPGARLALFGHSRASGSIDEDKSLSDRRARFVHAVLTANLPRLVSAVEEDSWEETHYVSLAHFLGYETAETAELFASFQRGYSAGHHLAPGLGRGEGKLEASGNLDAPTQHALLDAFLATVGSSLPPDAFAPTPCIGCGSFNAPPDGDHPDRMTLVVFRANHAPETAPCVAGDPTACHVEPGGGCRFFAERVAETSLQYRSLEGSPSDEEDLLYMGARVLVHEGARVASAVYNAPIRMEDIVYAYAPPPTTGTPPTPLPILPRVHFTTPGDKLHPRFSKERQLRPEMVPDGTHLRPMAWGNADVRTIEEVFLDFWSRAFEVVSQTSCKPTRDLLRPIYAALRANTPLQTPLDPTFNPVRNLSDTDFRVLALKTGMVAAGQALNSFESTRYAAAEGGGRYACNIYAADLVGILPQGAWLPKVLFTHPKRVRSGKIAPEQARLFAAGPTALNAFLNGQRGMQPESHGWFRLPGDTSLRTDRRNIRTEAQKLANDGVLVVMSAAPQHQSGFGHVAVVMPDLAHLSTTEIASLEHTIDPEFNEIHTWGYDRDLYPARHRRPFRSQAGAINGHGLHGGSLVMVTDQSKYKTPGHFRYDPTKDLGRGTELERNTKTPT